MSPSFAHTRLVLALLALIFVIIEGMSPYTIARMFTGGRRGGRGRSRTRRKPITAEQWAAQNTPTTHPLARNNIVRYRGSLTDANSGTLLAHVSGNVTTTVHSCNDTIPPTLLTKATRKGHFAYLDPKTNKRMTSYSPTSTSKARKVPPSLVYIRSLTFSKPWKVLNTTTMSSSPDPQPLYGSVTRETSSRFSIAWSPLPPSDKSAKRQIISFGSFSKSKLQAKETYDFSKPGKVGYKRHGECPAWYSPGRSCVLEMDGLILENVGGGAAVEGRVEAGVKAEQNGGGSP